MSSPLSDGQADRPRALVRRAPAGVDGEVVTSASRGPWPLVEALRAVPEEDLWLEGQLSAETRRAYRRDVQDFLEALGIRRAEQLRLVDPAMVVAWRPQLEVQGLKAGSIRRKLAALSSLFRHLVERHSVPTNPMRDLKRPKIDRRRGSTAAFSVEEARALLDAPDPKSLAGLRDRALLAVGLRVGPRRAEIPGLRVRDLHVDGGYPCLRFRLKGGRENSVAVHEDVAARLRSYLAAAGHAEDLDGPLFRAVSARGGHAGRRHLRPQAVDRLVKRYCRQMGLKGRYSAHSLRATFITRALENGASLEDVQQAAGHANPSTTKLYDRRRYQPERSASFHAVF